MSRSKKDKVGGHCSNVAYGTEDLSGWAEIWGATGVRYAKHRHTRLRRRANKIDKRQLFLEDYIPQEDEISYSEEDWFEAEFEISYFDDPYMDEDPYDDGWDYCGYNDHFMDDDWDYRSAVIEQSTYDSGESLADILLRAKKEMA